MKKTHFSLFGKVSLAAVLCFFRIAGKGLEAEHWYILPKIGIAPGLFAHRGHEHRVVPLANGANPAIVCTNIVGLGEFPMVQPNLAQTIVQQNKDKIPTFGQTFTNRVLDVGFEVGRNMCDSMQYYLEFRYNRASGNSCLYSPTQNYAAPDGCSAGSCSAVDAGAILTTSNPTYRYSNYSAYGGYLGTRCYKNERYFCDRLGLWAGFKIGILHRKQVTACISIPERTATVDGNVYTFAAATLPLRNIFCSSNAVSGGLSFGVEYQVCNSAALLLGMEILASCPLQPNANARHVLVDDPTHAAGAPDIPSGFFPQPTNTFPGTTGVFLQFPVWIGLRWSCDFLFKERF